ncbi:hypothetical protein EJ07DRAFT_158091 [Lizonia empirigonia]|nr:hypothetical protein EJ07DRAFT_158091 [Lizonia empirigonia]
MFIVSHMQNVYVAPLPNNNLLNMPAPRAPATPMTPNMVMPPPPPVMPGPPGPPENVAFLIRHNQASYGKRIEPNDISFASKNWTTGDTGNGYVGIGIFVNGNGFSHTILRTIMGKDEDVVDKLTEKADEQLQSFFPGV